MKKKKKMWEKISLSLIRDSLHIKEHLSSSIRLKRKTRREREREYVHTYVSSSSSSSMFFGLKLRCCRSKKTTLGGGWIPYVPPPEDNFSCHVSQVRFLCSIGRDDLCFSTISRRQKKRIGKNDCVDARFCLFFSHHTHLVLCVVNNKCLLSLDDDDDDEDRSR